MPRKLPNRSVWSQPLPPGTLSIGLWETDIEADRTRGDAVMARLFGLSEPEAAEGVAIARLLAAFHPDDLQQDLERRRRILEDGGVFVWEHRVVPAPGVVRWVLARGHYRRDAVGRMFGRGIVVDVTDSRSDSHTEGPARFLTAREPPGCLIERITERALEIEAMGGSGILVDITRMRMSEGTFNEGEPHADVSPLQRAADHAIAAQYAIAELADPELKIHANALLMALGRKLAQQEVQNRHRHMN